MIKDKKKEEELKRVKTLSDKLIDEMVDQYTSCTSMDEVDKLELYMKWFKESISKKIKPKKVRNTFGRRLTEAEVEIESILHDTKSHHRLIDLLDKRIDTLNEWVLILSNTLIDLINE